MKTLIVFVVILVLYALLSGCATQSEPATVYKTVQVPVAVSCIATWPARPKQKSNADLRALDSGAFVVEIAAERLDLLTYADLMDAAVKACK